MLPQQRLRCTTSSPVSAQLSSSAMAMSAKKRYASPDLLCTVDTTPMQNWVSLLCSYAYVMLKALLFHQCTVWPARQSCTLAAAVTCAMRCLASEGWIAYIYAVAKMHRSHEAVTLRSSCTSMPCLSNTTDCDGRTQICAVTTQSGNGAHLCRRMGCS